MANNEVLIYAEIQENGDIAPVVLELAGVAHSLAERLDNAKLSALLIGSCNRDYDKYAKEMGAAGINRLIIIDNERLKHYSTALFSYAAIEIIKQLDPSVVLIGATTQGRDLAPRISSALNTGLTADCTRLHINDKGQLAATRPTFGGNLMATILCKTMPQMASVRPNVFPKSTLNLDKIADIDKREINFDNIVDKVKVLEILQIVRENDVNLAEAEIIISGGRGMKTVEGFDMLRRLASLIGASVGCTRAAAEMKIAPAEIQIGQTGKTVCPKIYIACALSGAIQHTIGMSSSNVVIAINKDPKAQIFKIADYGIVGDVFEIIPEWINLLENK